MTTVVKVMNLKTLKLNAIEQLELCHTFLKTITNIIT